MATMNVTDDEALNFPCDSVEEQGIIMMLFTHTPDIFSSCPIRGVIYTRWLLRATPGLLTLQHVITAQRATILVNKGTHNFHNLFN